MGSPGGGRLLTGTVTFLFTDVAGSTALWDEAPAEMALAMSRHDELIATAVSDAGGELVRPRGEGDSRFAVFASSTSAIAAASSIATSLRREAWLTPRPIRVRVAVHAGEAELRDGDYYGSAVNRCARVRSLAHPGQVLVTESVAQLVADALPDGLALAELGVHRLKDLSRPERIYGLTVGDDKFPPLESLDSHAHNLPIQLTSFIGRQAQLRAITASVVVHRLVTLVGPPGAGKTRLALQAAADLIEQFPDGAWLVELAAITDPGLVPDAVAAALEVSDAPGRSIAENVAERLRDKRLLILLDNCEHLLDAAGDVTDRLLGGTPGLHVLATSQEALGLAGEAVQPVPSLDVPHLIGTAEPEAVSGYEAVQLFIDRATLARPDFAVTSENAGAMAQICERLDGIPLAIEFAAARVNVLTPKQIVERLDHRFALLSKGSRNAPTRHQTLRAALEWSHHLLTPQEQTLLRRLAAFSGTFGVEAVEAVCGTDPLDTREVFDLLVSLVEKSLVTSTDDGRYRLLETIRVFAEDELDFAGETDAMHDRHLDWALQYCAPIGELFVSADQDRTPGLDALCLEEDNLVAAVNHSIERNRPAGALGLLCVLAVLWSGQSRRLEYARRLFAQLLEAGEVDDALRVKALRRAGNVASQRGDLAEAQALYEAGAEIAEAIGDAYEVVASVYNAGMIALCRGELRVAEQLMLRAHELGHATEGGWDAPSAGMLAWLAIARGDAASASRLVAGELSKDLHSAAHQLTIRGVVALMEGDLIAAHGHLTEALALCRRALANETLVAILAYLAAVHRLSGDLEMAAGVAEEGVSIARQGEDGAALAAALYEFAQVQRAKGQRNVAVDAMREAVELQHNLGDAFQTAMTVAAIGCLIADRGDLRRSAVLWAWTDAHLDAIGGALFPWERADVTEGLEQVRVALAPAEFNAAADEGRRLSLDAAVALAIASLE